MSSVEAENLVSWASAFWGLVPFAINSMTQPSGIVCGASADVGFLLRSSPVICVLDALLVLSRIGVYYWETRSMSNARTNLALERFQDEIYDSIRTDKTFATLRKHDHLYRYIVLALALSQLVKLFSFEGVIWTKVIAAMYLASYMVTEYFVVWSATTVSTEKGLIKITKDAKNDEHKLKYLDNSGSLSVPYLSIACAVAFMLWFSSVAFRDIFGSPHHTLPRWTGVVVGGLGTIASIPAFGYNMWLKESWNDLILPAVALVPVVGLPISFYFLGQAIKSTLPQIWVQVTCAGLAVLWTISALYFSSKATYMVRAEGREKQRQRVEQVAAFYFFLLQLTTGFLFYYFSYDPAGTVQPRWTTYLG